ncbi:MAG: dihydrolipoyl dehydrogenase [Candidatus Bipolaricaulia bacterium]
MAANPRYDLVVIGAGPGGYVAAIRAAQLGMSVACVEKEASLGGTCLRVGCIPSKALLDSSEYFSLAQHQFVDHGIKLDGLEIDVPAMIRRKDKVVKGLTQGVAGLFKKHKVERLNGTARLTGPDTVDIDGEDAGTVEADRVLVATGSSPADLDVLPFDGERVITSADALELDDVPERMLVVGGGYIGLEMGSVWSRLGSNVIVAEMLDQILPGIDPDLTGPLHKALKKQGLDIRPRTKASDATVHDEGVEVTLETEDGGSQTETVDKALVAVGRRPHTDGLGLNDVGVELDDDGHIVVDEHYRTSIEGVHAIGDVINRGPMLAHVAQEEGIACAERIAGQAGRVNYEALPAAVYTNPEMAWVGKFESECEDEGIDVNTGTFPFQANGRAQAFGESTGLVKVVAHAETDQVLGVGVLGPRASDIISECVVAMEFGASAEDIARTCHAHPTFPEAIKEAALDVDGRVIHM